MLEIARYRFCVAIVLTIVLVVVWPFLVFMPAQSHIASIKDDLATLDQEVADARLFLCSATQVQDIKNRMEKRRSLLYEIASSDSLESFVDALSRRFIQQGANNVELAPDLSNLLQSNHISLGNARLVTSRFHLHCHGRFLELGKAIEMLEQQPYFVNLYTVDITYDELLSPQLQCDLLFDVYLREISND